MSLPTSRQLLSIVLSVALVSTITFGQLFGGRNRNRSQAAAASASRPHHEVFGLLPGVIDQTITRQNSAADKLRIDITHSHVNKEGKNVAFVRLVWGDLDNIIKGGGPQYYSDWDGSLSLTGAATGQVLHQIAFDDAGKVTTHPAGAEIKMPAWRLRHASSQPSSRPRRHRGPGQGSGADELVQSQGHQIVWKAGVVGALDGLLIRIASDSPTMSGNIVAGKFAIPFSVTPGETTNK
jgi:hypothetical protein